MPLTLNKVKKALSAYPQLLGKKGWNADNGNKKNGCFSVDFRNAMYGDAINRTVTVCQKGVEISVTTEDGSLLGNYDLYKSEIIPKAVNSFLLDNKSCHLFIDHRAAVIECKNKTLMKEPIGNLVDHLEAHHPFVIPLDLSLGN